MNKGLQKISFVMVLSLILSVFATFTAAAASEAKFVYYGSKGGYITISNVIEEKSKYLFIASSPAKITFASDELGMQDIYYAPDAKISGTKVDWGDFGKFEKVEFDVKKFTYAGEDKVYDEHLDTQFENEVSYLSGNYATLNKPGIYQVEVALPAQGSEVIAIQVVSQDQGAISEPNKPTSTTVTEKANPTASKVLINGKEVSFEAYNIGGNNYFKLRDLAAALNGSKKSFEVKWDGAKNAISLESGKAYTPVGGELQASGKSTAQTATATDSKIYLDGKEVQLTAYNIGGNNYFKLRDIGKLFDLGVTWNGKANTIEVDTSASYKDE